MRAARDTDLSTTARRLVSKAEAHGWNVVGVVSSGETVLTIRGRRAGGGRFSVLFLDGSFDAAWWWTRQHSAVVKGYRSVQRETRVNAWTVSVGTRLEHDPDLDETVTWTSERATPVRLGSLSALVGVASRGVPGLLATETS